ncbi:MAG: PD-(D/E)XK nuclease family protein [Endomicrobia bacterium]|nr:PD-(D/E)XK nuclease family protein [Endomicrobiia bacterium]
MKNLKGEQAVSGIFDLFIMLASGVRKIFEYLKFLFVPKIVLTVGKISDMRTCGLKYKFQYYYNLDEVLAKEYPEGLIGQLIHQYIYKILNKEIKVDLEYISLIIMQQVLENFPELTPEDRLYYEKNIRTIFTNFNCWYEKHKQYVYTVNSDIVVKHNGVRLKMKCDCILVNRDNNFDYWVIDFATSKRNIISEMLPYDVNTNLQYFVLKTYFEKKKKKFKFSKFFLLYDNLTDFVENWSMQEETRKIISEVKEKLRNKEYELHKGPLCGWCGYYDICPGWKTEREGDKQKGIEPVSPDTTLFRIARETPGRMALSYSKMSMYIQCPRRYRLCYIDRLGVKPQGFFSIGSTIHNTLELFYKIKPKKRKEPSIDELFRLYDQCWISAGYSSKQEEQEYYQNGKKWLTSYYEKFVKEQYLPAYMTEEYFELPIGKGNHVMIGYIDRVQNNPDGTFEILDYKTDPKVRTQEEVDKDLQLTIYYWAMRNKGIDIKRLGLIFIRFGEIIYTTRSQKDIDLLDDYVKNIGDKMWADGEKYISLKKEYETKGEKPPEEKIEEIFPSKINKYCGGCDYLKGCPKEQLIKTEYQDKLLFKVSETGEIIDKEIQQELTTTEQPVSPKAEKL